MEIDFEHVELEVVIDKTTLMIELRTGTCGVEEKPTVPTTLVLEVN